MSAPACVKRSAPGLVPGADPQRRLAAWVRLPITYLVWAWIVLAWLAWPVTPAAAHGVSMGFTQGQAAVAVTQYDGGEAMGFAKVRIINPQGQTHQVGNTDAQGRFAWLPDSQGSWRVTMEDGMGHLAQAQVETGPPASTAAPAPASPLPTTRGWQPDRASAVALGLSLIFWLWGLLLWRAGRRAQVESRA